MKTIPWSPPQQRQPLGIMDMVVVSVRHGESLTVPALVAAHLSLRLLRVEKAFVVRTMEGVIVYEKSDGSAGKGWPEFSQALGAYDYFMQQERRYILEELEKGAAAGAAPQALLESEKPQGDPEGATGSNA